MNKLLIKKGQFFIFQENKKTALVEKELLGGNGGMTGSI